MECDAPREIVGRVASLSKRLHRVWEEQLDYKWEPEEEEELDAEAFGVPECGRLVVYSDVHGTVKLTCELDEHYSVVFSGERFEVLRDGFPVCFISF